MMIPASTMVLLHNEQDSLWTGDEKVPGQVAGFFGKLLYYGIIPSR